MRERKRIEARTVFGTPSSFGTNCDSTIPTMTRKKKGPEFY